MAGWEKIGYDLYVKNIMIIRYLVPSMPNIKA